tara:strand:+ start:31 stop:1479 length:1449 start_codon:yes stop_codon:yes gene_type:complete
MGGGLLELVAHGVQDIYLIGNPQITFFKIVYKRHTNFSMESVQATFSGTADFGKQIVCALPRKGDLVHTIILEVDVPTIASSASTSENGTLSYVNSLGHALIDFIELEIGGQVIDKHYGEWMEIWTQLSYDESKQNAYDQILPRANIDTTQNNTVTGKSSTTVYIPLQFWFCRNIGLALPLIALQYHDVVLKIKFNPFSKVHTFGSNQAFTMTQSGTTITQSGTNPRDFHNSNDTSKTITYKDGTTATATYASATTITSSRSVTIGTAEEIYLTPDNNLSATTYSITSFRIYIDYIFLDTFERKKFAEMKHRYLIEQIQYNDGDSIASGTTAKAINLPFNLPVKSIYWVSQLHNAVLAKNNDRFNFSSQINRSETLTDPISKAVVKFNGIDRFEERNGAYFRLIQPFQKHTRVSKLYIYMYSFSLHPEAHQPSGACNFSKINNADLHLTFANNIGASNVRVYALTYNVLRIFSGMGSVAFSN